jgi:TolB protein
LPRSRASTHPIDSTVPRPTSSTLIPTATETKINGDHGVSPDGSLIATGNQDPDGQARIYVVSTAGGTPRRVTPNGPAYFHGRSPDGKTISFTTQHGDNFDAYTIPVAGGPETLLAPKSDVAEFSPDGQWISF